MHTNPPAVSQHTLVQLHTAPVSYCSLMVHSELLCSLQLQACLLKLMCSGSCIDEFYASQTRCSCGSSSVQWTRALMCDFLKLQRMTFGGVPSLLPDHCAPAYFSDMSAAQQVIGMGYHMAHAQGKEAAVLQSKHAPAHKGRKSTCPCHDFK